MPPEVRRQRGIPPDYSTNASFVQEQVETWHIERESFKYDQVLQFSQGLKCLLIVCGSEHACRLGERFRAEGHSVVVDDVRGQPWYIEDWVKHLTNS